MRVPVFSLLLFFLAASSGVSQVVATSTFLSKVQTLPATGKPISKLDITGQAFWYAGSQIESGTVAMSASQDGSSTLTLNLGSASRTEAVTAANAQRDCQWQDAKGLNHDVTGQNCFFSSTWFAPSLLSQPPSLLPLSLSALDEGEVSKDGTVVHEIAYKLNLIGSGIPKLLLDSSRVRIGYATDTYLPTIMEYSVQPDGKSSIPIAVKVLYSDYRLVNGISLPFHIEKYVNRSLQLKIEVASYTSL